MITATPLKINIPEVKGPNPKECDHAIPYMVNNGVLDIYVCEKFHGNCYFVPNGGKQFKKICE
jgi:hypothetical protein